MGPAPDVRIEALKSRIHQKVEPTYTAWLELARLCREKLSHSPNPPSQWAVPGVYDNPNIHEAAVKSLTDDSAAAYEEALCFRLSGESKYADKAAAILTAWSTILKSSDSSQGDTKLSMNEFFPTMIVAADLLRKDLKWTEGSEQHFKTFLRQQILPLNTMTTRDNNWGNWGVLLVSSIGAYLNDPNLLALAESRFRQLIDIAIRPDGTLPREMDRSDTNDFHGGPTKGKNGIWYTNYTLMPTTLAAEILLLNGRDLYDYTSAAGGSMQVAFNKISDWCLNPTTFPFYASNGGKVEGTKYISYFEILNTLWPSPEAEVLLKDNRPLTSAASFPHLTLTHGGLGSEKRLNRPMWP